ncbi:hypothetical protein Kpol_1038p7 [Vanderwaltozyma polyspora DSM 70294]|uniref:Peroxisomal membrane protein PMP27 n=1 Tax=Vanderwaltozyma polyspora (strain ATCC 22028 / DSM 70294 / BCRC 21397 / CBS 2163 / NBRC 10782 / NRRL Y-8283 / UCD 57-17) TaxID=436907 RepID=A7TQZ8_VANPO|nr:uncharacterized protein Kpol_1038p7 [Vanderwaltozyma polyspora DSM 70294]EDO15301.1 hypothetical protein Kpol_1038p7 [Vanderwaltozyma polyspora DSM 70294]
MVCDTVVYHPSITRLINYLDSTGGREKILRLLQYLARFLAVQQSSKLAKSLQSQFTLVRKFLRFLKPLNHLQAASKLYDNKLNSDLIIRYANIIKNLAMGGYLFLDQINLLRILKVIDSNNFTGTVVPRWTNWFWFFGLVASQVVNIRTIRKSQCKIVALLREKELEMMSNNENEIDKEKLIEDDKSLKAAYMQRYSSTRKLIWDSLDSFIVLNNLNYLSNEDGYIALSGVATSLLGIQDLWRGTKI